VTTSIDDIISRRVGGVRDSGLMSIGVGESDSPKLHPNVQRQNPNVQRHKPSRIGGWK